MILAVINTWVRWYYGPTYLWLSTPEPCMICHEPSQLANKDTVIHWDCERLM